MAGHLAKEIDECRAHAEDCARKADAALDDEARADFRRLERHWLQLAHSYELAQQIMAAARPRVTG